MDKQGPRLTKQTAAQTIRWLQRKEAFERLRSSTRNFENWCWRNAAIPSTIRRQIDVKEPFTTPSVIPIRIAELVEQLPPKTVKPVTILRLIASTAFLN